MSVEQALTEYVNHPGHLLGSWFTLVVGGIIILILSLQAMSLLETSTLEDENDSVTDKPRASRKRVGAAIMLCISVVIAAATISTYLVAKSNVRDAAHEAWQVVEQDLTLAYEIDGAGPVKEYGEKVTTDTNDLGGWLSDLQRTTHDVAEDGARVIVRTHDGERHTYQLTAYVGQLRLMDNGESSPVDPDELLRQDTEGGGPGVAQW